MDEVVILADHINKNITSQQNELNVLSDVSQQAFTLIEGDFRDRVRTDVSKVTEVLNLSYTSPYYIRFNFSYTNSQPVVRTITATLGTNSSSNGVNLVFNQDNSFDVQYTFQISTMEDEEEVVRDVSLVLTFSPLTYVTETTVA